MSTTENRAENAYEKEGQKNKQPMSRGIPSKEAMWLPAFYSEEVRKFEDDEGKPTRNVWKIEEVLKFVFPPKYQETYYKISVALMQALAANKGRLEGKDIGQLIKEKGFSKATLYNRVLPRLKRVGMIRLKRATEEGKNKKHMPMEIELSKTFANYLLKISDSFLAFIDDVRTR